MRGEGLTSGLPTLLLTLAPTPSACSTDRNLLTIALAARLMTGSNLGQDCLLTIGIQPLFVTAAVTRSRCKPRLALAHFIGQHHIYELSSDGHLQTRTAVVYN